MRIRSHLLCAALLASLSTASASPEQLQQLLNANCVSCHGPKKQERDLRLDNFATSGWHDFDLVDEMLILVEDHEMPPRQAKKPLSDEERGKLTSLLRKRLTALEQERLAGSYKKLTAQEYSDTLQDLAGSFGMSNKPLAL